MTISKTRKQELKKWLNLQAKACKSRVSVDNDIRNISFNIGMHIAGAYKLYSILKDDLELEWKSKVFSLDGITDFDSLNAKEKISVLKGGYARFEGSFTYKGVYFFELIDKDDNGYDDCLSYAIDHIDNMYLDF